MSELLVKAVLGYLLGSIVGSLLIGRLRGVDIRRMGSGNAGATNALRTQSKAFAFVVLLIDIAKGWIATGLLAVFIVIAFFGVLLRVNQMVFGARQIAEETPNATETNSAHHFRLPLSCRVALFLAAIPVLVLGVYIPTPLHDLLMHAASALTR